MYPPGYPALLAAWTAIGGNGFSWLVVLQIMLAAGTLLFTFDALRRITPPFVALGTLLILAVNPHLIHASGAVMSESPLAFCFAAALWASVSMARGPRQTVVLITVAVLAPMMRTMGVVLPVAIVADWLLARRYRDTVVAVAVFGVTVGSLFAWTMSDPVVVTGNSYAADLVHKAAGLPLWHTVLNRVFRNGFFYLTQGVPVSLPAPTIAGTRIDNVIVSLVIVSAFAMGLIPSFRKIRVPLLACLAMAGLLSMWPWPVARYLVPALPLLVPMLLLGIASAGEWISPRAAAIGVLAFALVVSAAGGTTTATRIAEGQQCDHNRAVPDSSPACMTRDQASFFGVVQYVNDSLPKDARLVAAKAAPLYYYTKRRAIPSAQLTNIDSATFWTRLHNEQVDYVVLGALHSSEYPSLAHQLEHRCSDLQLVASFPPHTYLFRLVPPVAGATNSAAVRDDRACAAIRKYQHDAQPVPE
ncbi:MAG: glycosyltransferase family 39 protein, partial [bacterium]